MFFLERLELRQRTAKTTRTGLHEASAIKHMVHCFPTRASLRDLGVGRIFVVHGNIIGLLKPNFINVAASEAEILRR